MQVVLADRDFPGVAQLETLSRAQEARFRGFRFLAAAARLTKMRCTSLRVLFTCKAKAYSHTFTISRG